MDQPIGLLLDLDGVLYVENRLIPGAIEALQWLQHRRIPFRYMTNTSTRTGAEVAQGLDQLGLPADKSLVFSAVDATEQWLQAQHIHRIAPLMAESVVAHFAEQFEIDDVSPQAIVIGDIGEQWSYALLNRAFHWLMAGAQLVAVHRNRFWQTGSGLQLDIGAFVAGLEYAAGVEAVIVGKPSAGFFTAACRSMSLEPDRVIVVGDDVDSDVGGAQAAGSLGVLVETGKYRAEHVRRSEVGPDHQIGSIADLPNLLETLLDQG